MRGIGREGENINMLVAWIKVLDRYKKMQYRTRSQCSDLCIATEERGD